MNKTDISGKYMKPSKTALLYLFLNKLKRCAILVNVNEINMNLSLCFEF